MDIEALKNIELNYPAAGLKLRQGAQGLEIRCLVRKRWLLLLPEEWVRQHVVSYLHREMGYSLALMKLEGGMRYNGLSKRSDITVFDQQGKVYLLVEVKAASEALNEKAWGQTQAYQNVLRAPYMALTNGKATHVLRCAEPGNEWLPSYPPPP